MLWTLLIYESTFVSEILHWVVNMISRKWRPRWRPASGRCSWGCRGRWRFWFWGNLPNFPLLAYMSIQREYVMLLRTRVPVLLQLADNFTTIDKCWRLSNWCPEIHNPKFIELIQKEHQGGRQHESKKKKVMSEAVKCGNHYKQNTLAHLSGWGRPVRSLPAPMNWTQLKIKS